MVSFWDILSHLCDYPVGEWHHNSNNQSRYHSSEAHVFFPRQFFLPRNLLCIGHSSQDAHGPLDPERNHFFFHLCCPNVLLPYPGATERSLLAVRAYDRGVAVCDPLHYPLVMAPRRASAWWLPPGSAVLRYRWAKHARFSLCLSVAPTQSIISSVTFPIVQTGLWKHLCE